MSAEALLDPAWRDTVERHVDSRLVPVKAGNIDDDRVPQSLREINWIQWRLDAPRWSIEQVYVALHTDLGRYRDAQSLSAQASAWVASGRNEDYLVDDVPKLRQFGRVLRSSQDEGAATISLIARQFLVASALHARRQRNRRARSIGWRLGLLVIAMVAVIGAVQAIATARQQYVAAIGFTASRTETNDTSAIKVASLLLRAQKTHAAFPAVELRVLAKAYGEQWDRAVLGGSGDAAVNGQVLTGSTVYGVDGQGRFDRWTLTKGVPFRTWQVSSTALYYLDVAGTTAVAADSKTLLVLDPDRHVARRITAPVKVAGVALAPAGKSVLVDGVDSVWRVPLSGGPAARLADSVRVLAVQRLDDGTARALVRDGGTVRLLTDSGADVESWRSAKADDELGSIRPDGSGIALLQNGTVRTSDGHSPLFDTGIVAVRARALAALRHGVTAVQTDAAGLQAYDTTDSSPIGQFCQRAPTVRAVSESPAGTLLCQSAGFGDVDSLAHAVPQQATAPDVPSTTAESNGAIQRLSIGATGLLHVLRRQAQGDRKGVFDPSASSLTTSGPTDVLDAPGLFANRSGATTVALAPGGATGAIGFTDGAVWEFDVDPSGRLAPDSVWVAPDHTAVVDVSWDTRTSSLRVTTRSGLRWTAPSCAGCFAAATIIAHLKPRLLLCYAAGDIATFDADTRQRLALTPCATPIAS